jgi:hypothetical protein
LRTTLQIPADKRARLLLDVSHDPRGDWQLVVRAGDKSLLNTTIGPKSTTAGWAHFEVDLAPVLGQKAELEILNQPNNWSFEYAYWGRVQIVVE